jgi:hypothetical protein
MRIARTTLKLKHREDRKFEWVIILKHPAGWSILYWKIDSERPHAVRGQFQGVLTGAKYRTVHPIIFQLENFNSVVPCPEKVQFLRNSVRWLSQYRVNEVNTEVKNRLIFYN